MAKSIIFDSSNSGLRSLKCGLKRVAPDVSIEFYGQDLAKSNVIVLPCVDNFMSVTKKFEYVKNFIPIKNAEGVTLLGICPDQLLFESSKEDTNDGLTFFKDKIMRLYDTLNFSHMDGSTFNLVKSNLFNGINEEFSCTYFVCSSYPMIINECVMCTKTTYGITFTFSVVEKNMYDLQFQIETSNYIDLQILQNFAKIMLR